MLHGKQLVEEMERISGIKPKWTRYHSDDPGRRDFSTAKFSDLNAEHIAAIMPFETTKYARWITIDMTEYTISMTVACDFDDAPNGTEVYNG